MHSLQEMFKQGIERCPPVFLFFPFVFYLFFLASSPHPTPIGLQINKGIVCTLHAPYAEFLRHAILKVNLD